MIPTTDEYKIAIDAPTRRIVPKAVIDMTDPDLEVTSVTGDIESTYSFTSQLADKDMTFSGQIYATLETSRWILDGSQSIMPNTPSSRTGEQGVIGDTLSSSDGSNGTTLAVSFSGVEILQTVTLASTNVLADGHPLSVTLDIYSGGVVMVSRTETLSGSSHVFQGFTVTQPGKIEITINSWSLPGRRYRFVEFLPGHIETWGEETVYDFDVIRKADISNLTLPYASATLEIVNEDHRFDPPNKDGIFLSLVAKQPVDMSLGVEINGSFEYVPCGIYYLKDKGWTIQNGGMTIRFDMVDIVGLLSGRKFVLNGAQPTTLEGWVSEIVDQLGFTGQYIIDDTLGTTSLVCDSEAITDITSSDLLRYVCQAAGAFPVSDPATGYLHICKLNNTVHREITLRSQNSLPGSTANQDIAFLTFTINDTEYNIPGTEEISDKTVKVNNPFITTMIGADLAAQAILPQYGGNRLNLGWRGDMSIEPGDIEIVEFYPGMTTAARVIEQRLSLSNGIMTNVPIKLLQADGGKLYTDVIVITTSGTYTMPSGVTEITVVLIGGGDGGNGGDAGRATHGAGGAGGLGGKVYTVPLTINDGQTATISIGSGGYGGAGGTLADKDGKPGGAGGDTTANFGAVYSSASGVRMSHGYVDLITSKAFGIPGTAGLKGQDPAKRGSDGRYGTGNGGNGGDGGRKQINSYEEETWGILIEHALPGANGGRGGSGACLIFYAR